MLESNTISVDKIKQRISLSDYQIKELENYLVNPKTPEDPVFRIRIRKMINEFIIQRDTLKVVIGELPEEALLA